MDRAFRRTSTDRGERPVARFAPLVLLALLALPACVTERVRSYTPRTATEQLLLSESAERAVAALALPGVQGLRVAIEVVGLGRGAEFHDDLPYLRTALRERLRRAGAIPSAPEDAERTLVARVGALGTTSRTSSFGIPEIPLVVASTPPLNLYRYIGQSGYTVLRTSQYDRDGRPLSEGERVAERTRFREWKIMVFSFRSAGDVYPKGLGPD